MSGYSMDEHRMKRFFLRQLDAREREVLEDRLARDEEFLALLEHFETEWIDRYVRGELSVAEAAEMERYLLETGQTPRAAFAAALSQASQSKPRAGFSGGIASSPVPIKCAVAGYRGNWLALSAAAVSLVAFAVGTMFFINSRDAVAPQSPAEQSAEPAIRPTTIPSAVRAVTLTLPAAVFRSTASPPAALLPDRNAFLRLRLEIPAGRNFPSYRVVLLAAGDRVEWQASGPATNGEGLRYFQVDLSAAEAGTGSRELALYGLSEQAEAILLGYYFYSVNVADSGTVTGGSALP